ncbi:hypothetical protein F4818DRAFT_443594 [Hypoxylon cercidicola]|nr:hypothetical protein F4818DRAFT_443594 [Hypoxylon cercidicola]
MTKQSSRITTNTTEVDGYLAAPSLPSPPFAVDAPPQQRIPDTKPAVTAARQATGLALTNRRSLGIFDFPAAHPERASHFAAGVCLYTARPDMKMFVTSSTPGFGAGRAGDLDMMMLFNAGDREMAYWERLSEVTSPDFHFEGGNRCRVRGGRF